jgi:hypothetical protein
MMKNKIIISVLMFFASCTSKQDSLHNKQVYSTIITKQIRLAQIEDSVYQLQLLFTEIAYTDHLQDSRKGYLYKLLEKQTFLLIERNEIINQP